MSDAVSLALSAVHSLRQARGVHGLDASTRASWHRDLDTIEGALRTGSYTWGGAEADPYAVPMETPDDLRRGGQGARPAQPARPGQAPPQQQAPPAGTEVLGSRARQTLEAVDFTGFVAGLVQGTFQAIVDATARQIHEYARLVASLSQSVDAFSRDNVTPNQVRDWLAQRHSADLQLILPRPGQKGEPRLEPRRSEPPPWLADYDLEGRGFDKELVEGPLIEAARRRLGEERMQTLATMVLMGINRIVVDEGTIRARLQFHASAREKMSAEISGQQMARQAGIADRQVESQAAVAAMVSTVNVNAQADISLKADLVGEVSIKFRSETFNLDRFADSAAIQLINRHAKPPGGAPEGGSKPS